MSMFSFLSLSSFDAFDPIKAAFTHGILCGKYALDLPVWVMKIFFSEHKQPFCAT